MFLRPFGLFFNYNKKASNSTLFNAYFNANFSITFATPSWSLSTVISLATSLTAGTAFSIATPIPANSIIEMSFYSSPIAITFSAVKPNSSHNLATAFPLLTPFVYAS